MTPRFIDLLTGFAAAFGQPLSDATRQELADYAALLAVEDESEPDNEEATDESKSG